MLRFFDGCTHTFNIAPLSPVSMDCGLDPKAEHARSGSQARLDCALLISGAFVLKNGAKSVKIVDSAPCHQFTAQEDN